MSPDANITFGFVWICVGLLLGAPMALAFLKKDWLGGYGSLSRRLLRLSHIAFIMLGLLNIVYGYALKTGTVHFAWQGAAMASLLAGAAILPILLFVGIWVRKALWALPLPFLMIFAAVAGVAAGRLA